MLWMPEELIPILQNYRKGVSGIFGNKLRNIILFGSCARGEMRQDSDVDIMILADVQPEEVSYYADKIYDITYDFEMQYDLEVNPCIQSTQTYDKWKRTYPFFMNVEKEGVEV